MDATPEDIANGKAFSWTEMHVMQNGQDDKYPLAPPKSEWSIPFLQKSNTSNKSQSESDVEKKTTVSKPFAQWFDRARVNQSTEQGDNAQENTNHSDNETEEFLPASAGLHKLHTRLQYEEPDNSEESTVSSLHSDDEWEIKCSGLDISENRGDKDIKQCGVVETEEPQRDPQSSTEEINIISPHATFSDDDVKKLNGLNEPEIKYEDIFEFFEQPQSLKTLSPYGEKNSGLLNNEMPCFQNIQNGKMQIENPRDMSTHVKSRDVLESNTLGKEDNNVDLEIEKILEDIDRISTIHFSEGNERIRMEPLKTQDVVDGIEARRATLTQRKLACILSKELSSVILNDEHARKIAEHIVEGEVTVDRIVFHFMRNVTEFWKGTSAVLEGIKSCGSSSITLPSIEEDSEALSEDEL